MRRQVREVVPPATGSLAFPCLQALVRWDTEVVGSRWWGGLLPASGGGGGPGVRRWRYERVYPAQVWDPHAPLGRLVGVEPPDPRFNEVVRDLCPGGDERLELSHKDLGCRGMWQGDYGEKPVGVDVTEVPCPGCRDVPSAAWRLLDCGEGCPPAPCVGLGSGAGSLGRVSVACGPLGSGSAADPGREAADELDVSPAVWRGSA